MTSNLGSEEILEGRDDKVLDIVKSSFRPEFINRIDEIIVFNKLDKDSIYKIQDKIIKEIETRLKNINISLVLSDRAKDELVNTGFDPNFGARPLKRIISREIETLLSKEIINGNIKYGDKVLIDYENNKYIINRR